LVAVEQPGQLVDITLAVMDQIVGLAQSHPQVAAAVDVMTHSPDVQVVLVAVAVVQKILLHRLEALELLIKVTLVELVITVVEVVKQITRLVAEAERAEQEVQRDQMLVETAALVFHLPLLVPQ
jgi:hypothetical protein